MTEPHSAFSLLGQAAWERFRDRRAYEWKIFFGVWAGFGTISGFVLGSERSFPQGAATLALLASVSVFLILALIWVPWIQNGNHRDQKTSYYWYSAVERSSGHELPIPLRPNSTWPRFPGPEMQEASVPPRTWLQRWLKDLSNCYFGKSGLHLAPIGQITITAIICAAFPLSFLAVSTSQLVPPEPQQAAAVEYADVFRWGMSVAVPALSGLVGILIGARLTSRRERGQRRHEFISRQLRELYSPLLGLRNEIRMRSEFRVKVHDAANSAWQEECERVRPMGFEALDRFSKERFPEFGRILDYDSQRLSEDLVPLYRQMLKILRDNLWLAEPETRNHFRQLLEFVDVWDRSLAGALPHEVLAKLGHREMQLSPFYSHIQEVHDRLRWQLTSGTS